jgi:hypothetical protein
MSCFHWSVRPVGNEVILMDEDMEKRGIPQLFGIAEANLYFWSSLPPMTNLFL